MGWMSALAVLLMVAAAAGGFWASAVVSLKKPPTRGPFLAGVVCGVAVGIALTARRRGLPAVGASTLKLSLIHI